MIAVAAGALIAWAGKMRTLSAEYQRRADTYEASVPRIIWRGPEPDWARWPREMAKKYRQAARYPWLPVAPDPPEPK